MQLLAGSEAHLIELQGCASRMVACALACALRCCGSRAEELCTARKRAARKSRILLPSSRYQISTSDSLQVRIQVQYNPLSHTKDCLTPRIVSHQGSRGAQASRILCMKSQPRTRDPLFGLPPVILSWASLGIENQVIPGPRNQESRIFRESESRIMSVTGLNTL